MKDRDFKIKLMNLCNWFMGTSMMLATKGGYRGERKEKPDADPPIGGDYIVITEWTYLKPNPICGECLAPTHHKYNGEQWVHYCSQCKQRLKVKVQALQETTE